MMEVPCCNGLKGIIEEALKNAEIQVPVTTRILSITGEIKL